ncbi:MAG: DUF6364 family protein [Bacteroidota bacterium]
MSAETKKTKLTLTVRKDIIERAKQKAREKGVSLSQLFEKIMEEDGRRNQKNSFQELSKLIENSNPVKVLPETDRELYHKHLDKKYG